MLAEHERVCQLVRGWGYVGIEAYVQHLLGDEVGLTLCGHTLPSTGVDHLTVHPEVLDHPVGGMTKVIVVIHFRLALSSLSTIRRTSSSLKCLSARSTAILSRKDA